MFSTLLALAPMVSFVAPQPIADDGQTGFNIIMIFLTLWQIFLGI